jgi:hypothetical protein
MFQWVSGRRGSNLTEPVRSRLLSLRRNLREPYRRGFWIRRGILFGLFFLALYGIGLFLPAGFDWIHYYSRGRYHGISMPWMKLFVGWMNYPAVFALSMAGLAIRTRKYSKSPVPLILTLCSLPLLWILHLGNHDILVVLGLVLMPWGVPLALLKPHLTFFAMFAKRQWFLAGAAWGLLTLLLYGFWPLAQINGVIANTGWRQEWVQDISLFPWGLLAAIPLLWYSRGDEDLLMAAGSLATPHLFPYHFIVLMPALGRMRRRWMILTWLFTWSPLTANYLGPGAWHLGNFAGLCFWCGIYFNRKRASVPAPDGTGRAA